MTVIPQLSICIPAYNRPDTLGELLESIALQNPFGIEIVVCEDCSPARDQIRNVINQFKVKYPLLYILYCENSKNLGYDGNLRHLIEISNGDFCLFMGDDDLLCPGALRKVQDVINRNHNLGAINRAYRITNRFTGSTISESRYFPGDRFFPSGQDSAITFFRRFVFISGLVVHRATSLKFATNEFDGTLLYQLYLVANLLLEKDGYFISDILVLNRSGGEHFFGSSETEQALFAPRTLTPEHSLNFIKGMLKIAASVNEAQDVQIYKPILADLAAYAYPFLVLHSNNKVIFWKYARDLGKIGLGAYPMFWTYVLLLLVFNHTFLDKVREILKYLYKRTPTIGSIYNGEVVE